ncbi:hypothetical protein N0A02_26360 [Paraburkholderia acidicola]|uniref:Uncharacterized protein n=1 Tax=Paraburkholderia acidicola TaxID=1912599 RepID=A0ABV1LUI1_9BURK
MSNAIERDEEIDMKAVIDAKMSNNYKAGRTVRHKLTTMTWKIVEVRPDWLDCEKKIGRKILKGRFGLDEVEPYGAIGSVGITIYR